MALDLMEETNFILWVRHLNAKILVAPLLQVHTTLAMMAFPLTRMAYACSIFGRRELSLARRVAAAMTSFDMWVLQPGAMSTGLQSHAACRRREATGLLAVTARAVTDATFLMILITTLSGVLPLEATTNSTVGPLGVQ